MSRPDDAGLDDRVLLLAPTRKDAQVAQTLLHEAGITADICQTLDDTLHELHRGAAALIVPEELVASERDLRLASFLRDQPPWSDLPILILATTGADSAASHDAVRTLGNVTLLERPLRVATVLSAVRTAVRARQRQYQIRGHLAERARAEESLRQADQRKDEFLATLGHELRNPLAPLLTGVHLLKLTAGKDQQLVRILEVMERQTTHLTRLVDDLLEVSRITRGLVEVKHEPVDLVAAIHTAIDASRPALEAARHTVLVDLPSSPVIVRGDSVRLTQVFANLLTNAAKYTDTGGEIRLTATHSRTRARISVRDNGIGIPPAFLASVFDMFMQVDRSDRRAQGGLGIGLTLVRSLIEMHGGRVEARSEGLDTGSEFVVELPVLEANVHAAVERREPLPEFSDRRILIVDDNLDAAHTLAQLLEALGATVAVVHSGQGALDRLEHFGPDTILLDIGMPEMDGYEVARRIRATPDHADILLIALTGWGQDQDYRQSRAAGFDHHLVKPPDIDKLRSLLTQLAPATAVIPPPARAAGLPRSGLTR